MTYTVEANNDGAIFREALVERVTNGFIHDLSPHGRALVMGGARIGALEAAHEIAQMYPQLAARIYAKFGMSGWGG